MNGMTQIAPAQSCARIMPEIQNWLDSAGRSAMPDTVRDHIRSCSSCYGFVRQWNAVEMDLTQIKNSAPVPSSELHSKIMNSVTNTSHLPHPLLSPKPWKLAASVAVVVTVAAVIWQFTAPGVKDGMSHTGNMATIDSSGLQSVHR